MTKNKISAELYWHNYKYYPYEKELALREISSLFDTTNIQINKEYIIANGYFRPEIINKLVYFSKGIINGNPEVIYTIQQKIESGEIVNSKKQNTRYSSHGLHDYKGKFNPQVVHAMLNIFKVTSKHKVLDPFCGSGTSIMECAHNDIYAIGTDINPLATKIANAKILAVKTNVEKLKSELSLIFKSFLNELKNNTKYNIGNSKREQYLEKWFDSDNLRKIELYRQVVKKSNSNFEDILLILGSNLLRDYSLQEPADLRIRRRISPMPTISFEEKLEKAIDDFVTSIYKSQEIIGVKKTNNIAYNQDIRLLESNDAIKNDSFDFAITSPPYATALPYIDTQRLSLVWLDLINPEEIRPLEGQLIGSREFYEKNQLADWNQKLEINSSNLPNEIHNLCMELKMALTEDDGFRRQAVPSLMYRYFSGMKEAFTSVNKMLKKDAYFTLIVGYNKTTIGGTKYEIKTPELLGLIGSQVNFEYIENMELQTYQRYGLHSSNSVNKESLLILQKK